MIGPVETQLKTSLAAATSWATRWVNERWSTSLTLSDGDMPVASDGTPLACVEAEVIGGAATASIGQRGSRMAMRVGLFRIYLSVAQGSGLTDISSEADAIATYFSRRTLLTNLSTGEALRTIDVRIDDNTATYEEGNRFVRMLSVYWEYLYLS